MSRTGWAFVKTLIFTILVPGLIAVGLPYFFLSPHAGFVVGGWRLLGIVPITLGAALYLWCGWSFVFAGQGTPVPIDPPRMLVATGPYRRVRNPMYISVEFVLVGEAILFESLKLLGCAALFLTAAYLFVVFYEEPTLKKKFGAAYDDYCEAVPGWIPRLRAPLG